MDKGKVISITVAAGLPAKAEETAAREQRPVNELITDAVSRCLASDPELCFSGLGLLASPSGSRAIPERG
jgi:hypothetical protein